MAKNFIRLVVSIAVPLIAGGIGSFFTVSSVDTWYQTLEKPALNPPAWVFGPVWTTLFVLMGIALFLIWQNYSQMLENTSMKYAARWAIILFFVQLILNVCWSVVFFGMQNPGGALGVIIALWLAILATIVAFRKLSRVAAWLLVPYILWVTFATYLNYSIWMLN